jgi:CheY-like chemotaxis protein
MAKILLVDDEPDIVYLFTRLLEKQGHKVVGAYGGNEALKKTESVNPDIVLMDIMMPDLDGWKVSRKLKSDSQTQDIPIIMVSVRTSQDSVEKSIDFAHADAHLAKPASGKDIIKTINSFLGSPN